MVVGEPIMQELPKQLQLAATAAGAPAPVTPVKDPFSLQVPSVLQHGVDDAQGGTSSGRSGDARERLATHACIVPGEAYTQGNVTAGHVVFEMCGDVLCARTMHVSWKDAHGKECSEDRHGYRAKVFVPETSTDISVMFSVVGGGQIYKVDRNKSGYLWIKENGKYSPERFEYPSAPPQRVTYFLRGVSMRSWVVDVDERAHSQNLLEMMSRDARCVRTMKVKYEDENGQKQKWSGTGFNVKTHLNSSATNVEVTFEAVGGRRVFKVDRRDPKQPFVRDANGKQPIEKFVWSTLPSSVVFEIRGSTLQPFISAVFENDANSTGASGETVSGYGRMERWIDPASTFAVPLEEMPGIGGIVDITTPHNEFLLPPEVALFEPSQAEIFHPASKMRQIFLNTKLTTEESNKIKEFREALFEKGVIPEKDVLPRYLETCALRIVQTAKGRMDKAIDLAKACAKERVQRLPIAEADVLQDVKSGFIYWHGRDKKCRPLLVIRLERIGAMAKDKERAVKAVLFSLEYALRYIFSPGRVENWVVIIDLENVFSVVSPLSVGGLIGVASAIATALEKVYCGRMVWVKICNMPSAMLARAINGVIPAEKRDKVGFPTDVASEVAPSFEAHQLEERYGGTAPDTKPGETYPFRFFPLCQGDPQSDDPGEKQEQIGRNRSYSEWREVEAMSVHESTTLEFHEGTLWDESSQQAKERWLAKAKALPLTTGAAQELSKLAGSQIEPCITMDRFTAIVNPMAVQGRQKRAQTEVDWATARMADDDAPEEESEAAAAAAAQGQEKSILPASPTKSQSGSKTPPASPTKSQPAGRKSNQAPPVELSPEEKAADEEKQRKELEEATKIARIKVQGWLRRHLFKDINTSRGGCIGSSMPLHRAVWENNPDIVEALLLCGADKNRVNSRGRTPLEYAWTMNKKGVRAGVIRLLGKGKGETEKEAAARPTNGAGV